MPESETSKKLTRVIKLADALAQNLKKDVEKLLDVLKELKGKKREDKGDEPGVEEEKGE